MSKKKQVLGKKKSLKFVLKNLKFGKEDLKTILKILFFPQCSLHYSTSIGPGILKFFGNNQNLFVSSSLKNVVRNSLKTQYKYSCNSRNMF